MFSITVDSSDVIAAHRVMQQELITGIKGAAEQAKEILVESIRHDLSTKILRPRESTGETAAAIDGEVVWQDGDIIIGVGDMDKMSREIPWWRLQDEGGPISVKAVPGYFVDETGQRVPFDAARGPGPGPDLKNVRRSQDIFVYERGSGSIMWVKNPVRPKHYFDAGDLAARDKVLELFGKVMVRVFG